MGSVTEPAGKGYEPKDAGFAEDGTIMDKKIQLAATELAGATQVERQTTNPVARSVKEAKWAREAGYAAATC